MLGETFLHMEFCLSLWWKECILQSEQELSLGLQWALIRFLASVCLSKEGQECSIRPFLQASVCKKLPARLDTASYNARIDSVR